VAVPCSLRLFGYSDFFSYVSPSEIFCVLEKGPHVHRVFHVCGPVWVLLQRILGGYAEGIGSGGSFSSSPGKAI